MGDPRLDFLPKLTWNDLSDDDVIRISDANGDVYGDSTIEVGELRRGTTLQTVEPSGDTTGVLDTVAIQSAIDSSGACRLLSGRYYVSSVTLSNDEQSLFGVGNSTVLRGVDAASPVLKVTADRVSVRDLMTYGGLYGVEVDGAITVTLSNVWAYGASSHGLYGHGKTWTIRVNGGEYTYNGGDGINFVGTTADANGNGLCIIGSRLASNTGHGLAWCASGLLVSGCVIELNGDSGVYIHTVNNRNTVGASVCGNYVELNGTAAVELETTTGEIISGVSVDGNIMSQESTPCVLASGAARSVYYLSLGPGNYYNVTSGADPIQVGDACISATIFGSYESELTLTNRDYNTVHFRRSSQPTITERRTVNAAAGGTASTTNLVTLPAGAIIHDVVAHAVTAFNGNATKTLEVGVGGNIDKYIDTLDFDPGTLNAWKSMTGGTNNDQKTGEFLTASTTLIATWTNTASASAGVVDVYVTYSMKPAAAQ